MSSDTMAFSNQVVLNRDTAPDAGDTRYRDFLIEQRQCDHIQSIDAAYQEGYVALRDKVEADEGAFSDRLTDAQSAYFAYRKVMLLRKLSNLVTKKTAPGVYPPNRFLLPSCGGLSASLSQSAVIDNDMDKQPEHQKLSYGSWRRVLMANRFEKRRATFEMEYTRRLAADAMLRAEHSEKLARADDALISEERTLMSHGLGQQTIEYLRSCGNQVWSVVMRMTIRNALHDPSLQGSLEALGLSTVASNSHIFSALRFSTSSDISSPETQTALQDRRRNTNLAQRANGANGMAYLPSNPFIDVTKPRADFIRTLFGNNSTALLAGHTVTCASFMPIDSAFIALGTLGGAVLISHVPTGKIWNVLTGHYDKITTIKWAIEEDSTIFLTSGSADKTVRVWLVDRPLVVDLSSYMSTSEDSKSQSEIGTNKSSKIGKNFSSQDEGKENSQKSKKSKSLSKKEELEHAREEAIKELQKVREAREFGRVRLVGGNAECVQVITTEYPVLDIAFSPLTSSVIFTSSVHAKDYPLLLEQENESRVRRQQEFEMQSRAHQRRSSFSGFSTSQSRGRRNIHSTAIGKYPMFGGQGRKSSSVPPNSESAHARSLWDRGIRGAIGGLKTTAKAATKIVTLGGTLPVPASGLILKGQEVAIRGYLCAYNVTDGTLIQKRRIQSMQVDPTVLQKSSSYITSMCFDLSGRYIYAADRKGRIHAYEVATDESTLLQQPFINHSVPYGNETLLSSTWKNVEDWRGKFMSALEGKEEKDTMESLDAANRGSTLVPSTGATKLSDSQTSNTTSNMNALQSKNQNSNPLSSKEGKNDTSNQPNTHPFSSQSCEVFFTKLSIQHHSASNVTYLHALNSNNILNSFIIEFNNSHTPSSNSIATSDYNALKSSGNFVDLHAYRSSMTSQDGVLPGVSVDHPKVWPFASNVDNQANDENAVGKKKKVGLLKRFEKGKIIGQVASLATDVVRVGVNLGTAGIVSVNSTPIELKPVQNLIEYPMTPLRPSASNSGMHGTQSRTAHKRNPGLPTLSTESSMGISSSTYHNSAREEAMHAALMKGSHIGFSILPNSNSLVVATNSSAYLVSPFRDYLREGGGLIPSSTVLLRHSQMQNDDTGNRARANSIQSRADRAAFSPEKPSSNPPRALSTESPLRKMFAPASNFSLRPRRASLVSPDNAAPSPSKQTGSFAIDAPHPLKGKQIQVLPTSAALITAQKAANGSGVAESQVFAKFEAPMGLINFVTTSFDGKYVLLTDVDGNITVWALKHASDSNDSSSTSSQDQQSPSASRQRSRVVSPRVPSAIGIGEPNLSNFSSPYVKSKSYARTPTI